MTPNGTLVRPTVNEKISRLLSAKYGIFLEMITVQRRWREEIEHACIFQLLSIIIVILLQSIPNTFAASLQSSCPSQSLLRQSLQKDILHDEEFVDCADISLVEIWSCNTNWRCGRNSGTIPKFHTTCDQLLTIHRALAKRSLKASAAVLSSRCE